MDLLAITAAAAGYIVNAIKNSKGGKQAAEELSTAIWEWIRPIFLKEDEKLVKDLEENPEDMKAVLAYQLKRKAEGDEHFATQLAKLVEEAKAKGISNSMEISGDDSQGFQQVEDSRINITKTTQTHHGSGDNVARDKIVNK